MDKLVSIIIPIYNSSKYIDKCINSVLEQTYSNIQLILVDDFSTDDSFQKCNNYAKGDNRITVLQNDKNGVSAARNTGLDAARGEYIQFLDSDDTIDKDMTQKLVNNIKDSKLCVCGYKVWDDGKVKKHNAYDEIINIRDYIKKYCLSTEYEDMGNYIWNKLYNREVIEKNDLRFNVQMDLMEDAIFNLDYCESINSVSIIKDTPYNYYIRSKSLVRQNREVEYLLKVYEKVYESYKSVAKNIGFDSGIIESKILYYYMILTDLYAKHNDVSKYNNFMNTILNGKNRNDLKKAKCKNLNYRIFKQLYKYRMKRTMFFYTKLKFKLH